MFSIKTGQSEASIVCSGQVAAWLEDHKVPSALSGQGNLANKL